MMGRLDLFVGGDGGSVVVIDLFLGGDGGSVAVVISGAVGICGSFKCGL